MKNTEGRRTGTADTIRGLFQRVAALEQEAFEEPEGEIWELLKQLRAERGLPSPQARDYGNHGRDVVREVFGYLRENAEMEKSIT